MRSGLRALVMISFCRELLLFHSCGNFSFSGHSDSTSFFQRLGEPSMSRSRPRNSSVKLITWDTNSRQRAMMEGVIHAQRAKPDPCLCKPWWHSTLSWRESPGGWRSFDQCWNVTGSPVLALLFPCSSGGAGESKDSQRSLSTLTQTYRYM